MPAAAVAGTTMTMSGTVVLAVAGCVLAGALVGRWWTAVLPFVAAAALAAYGMASDCRDCDDAVPLGAWVAIGFGYAAAAAAAVATGVAARRLATRRRRGTPPAR